jgi:hypothetical protein
MDSLIACVADAIKQLSGSEVQDYDATADFAANLADGMHVREAARQFTGGQITQGAFDEIISGAAERTGTRKTSMIASTN